MSRTKPQIINFYAGVLHEAEGLNGIQYDAVRTALAFACSEIEDNYVPTLAELHNKWVDANNEAARLKMANEEAEEEIGRLCSELQAVEFQQLSALMATVNTNGTHQVKALAAQLVSIDAQAAQESATEEQPDPTPAAPTDRKPFAFKWPTLDDKSLEIVQQLDGGQIAWRTLEREDKRIIVLAAIAELQLDMPPGQQLGLLDFDRRRPMWMSGFSSITQSLGHTWTQLLNAATRV